MWGRFPTCSGFFNPLDHCKQAVERRLKTGAQDEILPHNRAAGRSILQALQTVGRMRQLGIKFEGLFVIASCQIALASYFVGAG